MVNKDKNQIKEIKDQINELRSKVMEYEKVRNSNMLHLPTPVHLIVSFKSQGDEKIDLGFIMT